VASRARGGQRPSLPPGLLLAIAGFVISVLGLFSDQQATPWRASRATAMALAALSIFAIVAALIAA
jgi:hypothetical protein